MPNNIRFEDPGVLPPGEEVAKKLRFEAPGGDSAMQATPATGGNTKLKFGDPTPEKPMTVRDLKKTSQEAAIANAPMDVGASNVMRGLSFGLSDRIGAAPLAIKQAIQNNQSLGDAYDDILKRQFAARDAYEEQNPITSIAQNLFGGLLTGAGAANAVKTGASAVAPKVMEALSNSALGRGALNVLGGGLAGAVSGAGQAQPNQMAQGALNGAGTGAAAGGAIGGLGALASGIGRKLAPTGYSIGKWLGVTDPDKWATGAITKSLEKDNTNPLQYSQQLKQLAGNNAPNDATQGLAAAQTPIIAMDNAGPSLGSRVQKALSRDTQAKQALQQRMDQVADTSADRIDDALRSTLSRRLDPRQAMQDANEHYASLANPLYQQARELGQLDSPELLNWFKQSPNRMQALNDLRTLRYQNGDTPIPKLRYDGKGNIIGWQKPPTVDDAMAIKDYLGGLRDNMYQKDASNPAFGYINENFKSFRDLLDNLTGGEQSPLKAARALTGEKYDVQNALQAGMQFKSMTKDALQDTWNNLGSDAEKQAFRIGAAQSLSQGSSGRMDNSMGSRVNLFSGNKAMRDKLDMIMPDDASKQAFQQMLGTEGKLADSYSRFNPSNYVSNSSEESGVTSALQALSGLLHLNPRAIAGGLHGMANEANIGMADDQANALLRRMMSSPDEFQAFANQLAAKANGIGPQVMGGLSAAAGAAPVIGGNIAGQTSGADSSAPSGPTRMLLDQFRPLGNN